MKKLTVLSLIGLTLSFCAAIYMTTRYFSLFTSENTIQALAPSQDFMVEKISVLLKSNANRELIMKEMKSRHDHNELLHKSLSDMVAWSKERVLEAILLWVGAILLFGVLLLRLDSLRRRENH